jgi:hypothetical protein
VLLRVDFSNRRTSEQCGSYSQTCYPFKQTQPTHQRLTPAGCEESEKTDFRFDEVDLNFIKHGHTLKSDDFGQ